jgi:ABC-type phosphate/phosphonate transport system ATPase subunit
MSNMVFKIHDIECSYGSHQVLKGVNFEVAPGSFLGIIGPNAAGKSTLLKAITAALKPTAISCMDIFLNLCYVSYHYLLYYISRLRNIYCQYVLFLW